MVKSSWNDIDTQGRKMAKIVRLCESFVDKELKKPDNEKNHDLVLAYMSTLIKSAAHQTRLTETNMKLNMIFKLAEKKYGEELIEQGLKELANK